MIILREAEEHSAQRLSGGRADKGDKAGEEWQDLDSGLVEDDGVEGEEEKVSFCADGFASQSEGERVALFVSWKEAHGSAGTAGPD